MPVWITGIGPATPLGNEYAVVADHLLAGVSGVRSITAFETAEHPSRIAATVETTPCPQGLDPIRFERLEKVERLTLWCCARALQTAGLWERRGSLRIGLVLGNAAEWNCAWERDYERDGRRIFTPEGELPLVRRVASALGLSGPAISVSAACASGNVALALGRRWLELGWVDVCVAGACDAAVTPLTLAGFGNLRTLSRRNEEPTSASRPFDRGRDGFVIGEGGVMFTLERAERARRRAAPVHAEIAGYGSSSDAHHIVIPSPDPSHAARAMRQALDEAEVDPRSVDYVNAHATSTPVGDLAESKVLAATFGPHLRKVAVSSTKSMTGHLLTGAAAIEALACIAALERQAVPPTINLSDPDPECPLHHIPHEAQPRRVHVAVSNSFGFGGSNTCLVLRAA